MYLKKLKIRNFRNFYKSEMDFNSEDNILIGDNGSGKTNLFCAIRLVLDSSYKLDNYLSDKDFNKKNGYINFGEWIIISALLTGFKDNDDSISSFDFVVNEDDESYINFFFKPKTRILETLESSYSEYLLLEGKEKELKKKEMNDFIRNLSIDEDYEIARTFNKPFDFFDDELYYQVIGNYKDIVFENNYYCNADYIGVDDKVYNALKQINITYVPPIRDVRDNLASANGMFSKLIGNSYDEITDKDKEEINNKVVDLNKKISSVDKFVELKNNMHEKMDVVGKNYFNSKFQIESTISNDKKDIIKNLDLKIFDYEDVVDIWRKSLGEANVIYFALKLLETERKVNSFRSILLDLLLIEEPEAHIHGHLQKSLFGNLTKNNSRQLILSTHSVNISEVSKISKMLVLVSNHKETTVCKPSNGLAPNMIRKVERYLDANRSMLLFSKNVMLVEGDAENIIIPWIVKKTLNISLDEMGIGLINVSSSFFDTILCLFNKDRITKKCSILTDLDTDITHDSSGARAEQLGAKRKEKIDSFSKNNEYIKGFYAENTFEIQMFVIPENLKIMKAMINSKDNILYVDKDTKQKKLTALDNKDSLKETIIDVVEHKKKGWFALEFIDYCDTNDLKPVIPKYIIDALFNLIVQINNFDLIKWIMSSLFDTIDSLKEKGKLLEHCINFEELKIMISGIDTGDYLINMFIDEVLKLETK